MPNSSLAYRRLHHHHLTQPTLGTPTEVVRWFGAVQAQEFPSALWGMGLRMPNATEKRVEQAVNDRSIVRTWPMRATIHFVLPEDARWMVKLLAQRQLKRFAGMYHKAGLTEEVLAQAGKVLEQALSNGEPRLRKELYATLTAAGIETAGDQRGMFIVTHWAHRGLICLGPRQGKQYTFVLSEAWLPPAPLLEGDEALATLAARYFRSHGPATLHDFVWWTGLTVGEAKRGIELAAAELESESVEERTYWAHPLASPAPPPADAFLLPAFDEYTVAYKDRSAVVSPEWLAVTTHGLAPAIILDGQVVGTWKRTLKKDEVQLSLSLLRPLGTPEQDAIAVAAERHARFLECRPTLRWEIIPSVE